MGVAAFAAGGLHRGDGTAMVLPELGSGNGQLIRGGMPACFQLAAHPLRQKREKPKSYLVPLRHKRQHLGHQDAGLLGAKGGHIEELVAELVFGFTVRVGELLLQPGVRGGQRIYLSYDVADAGDGLGRQLLEHVHVPGTWCALL